MDSAESSGESAGKENTPIVSIKQAYLDAIQETEAKRKLHQEKVQDWLAYLRKKPELLSNLDVLERVLIEEDLRNQEDTGVVQLIASLAGVVDYLLDILPDLLPLAELTMQHDSVYQELKKIIDEWATHATKEPQYVV